MMKLKLSFKEDYIDCGHAGCSGGETHDLKIQKEDGTILEYSCGGCFGSELYYTDEAIKKALELLGYEVEIDDLLQG